MYIVSFASTGEDLIAPPVLKVHNNLISLGTDMFVFPVSAASPRKHGQSVPD
jgi:hypothetical protein